MIDLPETRIGHILDQVLRDEGGYVNDPADRGGETNFGITVARARVNGYGGPMKDLPRALALSIYRRQYVTDPGFDKVLAIEPSVAEKLINAGVNVGPARASTWLQRALNAFDRSPYVALKVDGNVGAATLDALRSFVRWRGPLGITTLLKAINSLQGAFYIGLTESDPSQRRFAYGWISNRLGAIS